MLDYYYIWHYNLQYSHFGDEFKKAINYLLKFEFPSVFQINEGHKSVALLKLLDYPVFWKLEQDFSALLHPSLSLTIAPFKPLMI